MKRIETVRLYPTTAQQRALDYALHATRHLFNAALQERKDAYRLRRVSLTHKMQYAELTALRRESYHLKGVYRELEDAVLHRLDLGQGWAQPGYAGCRIWTDRTVDRRKS